VLLEHSLAGQLLEQIDEMGVRPCRLAARLGEERSHVLP